MDRQGLPTAMNGNEITELVQRRDATLRLSSVDLQIAMAELYEGINVEAENAA